MKSLDIDDADNAVDGPCDTELLDALVLAGEPDADPVIKYTRRIGRFREIVEGILAAAEFDRRARKAADEVAVVGKLMVRKAILATTPYDWTAAMMSLYRTITGKEPAISVGACVCRKLG